MFPSGLLRRLDRVVQWLASLANLPIVLLSAALGVVMVLDGIPLLGLLVPADVAIMIAIAVRGPLESIPVFIGVVAGYLVTASLGFLIGRHYGSRVRTSRLGTWIGDSRWETGERILAHNGTKMLIFTPFLPFISTMVPVAAGMLHVPYKRFVSSIAIGSVAWACMYVTLGACAGAIGKMLPGGSMTTIASIVVGLILSTVVIQQLRRMARLTPCEPA